jgi:hypothetical protein
MNSSREYIQLAINSIESLYGTLDDGSIDFDEPVEGSEAVDALPYIRNNLYCAKEMVIREKIARKRQGPAEIARERWGPIEDLLIPAFRYYLGRGSIAAFYFIQKLRQNWCDLPEGTRQLITTETQEYLDQLSVGRDYEEWDAVDKEREAALNQFRTMRCGEEL